MRPLVIPLGAALIAMLAACQTGPAPPAEPAAPAENAAPELSDVDRAVANLAIDALAAELGIARERIAVQSVTFRSSDPGAPPPSGRTGTRTSQDADPWGR